MDISNLIQTIAIYALPVIFAITVHEAAHGYVARYFGDNTAWMLGRLTLNPLKHIDPLGTIAIPILLYLSTNGNFLFGYAKPVPVDTRYFKNPKRDMAWVALAGPTVNFVQALMWAVLLAVLSLLHIEERFFIGMAQAGILVNLVMWAFNLFPLPPLDGGRVLAGVLPRGRMQYWLMRIEPYGFFIVLGLVLLGLVGTYWLSPLIEMASHVINFVYVSLLSLGG